jgi:hypothetical protein
MDMLESLPRVVDDEAAVSAAEVGSPAHDDFSVVEDDAIEDTAGAADARLVGVTDEGEEARLWGGVHRPFSLMVREGAYPAAAFW